MDKEAEKPLINLIDNDPELPEENEEDDNLKEWKEDDDYPLLTSSQFEEEFEVQNPYILI